MMQRLTIATQQTFEDLISRWRLLLALAVAGGWIAFAFWLSDVQDAWICRAPIRCG